MSLLMDALRKAEADKKQEAEGEQEKLALTSGTERETRTAHAAPAEDSDPSINVSFAETVDLGRATRDMPRPASQPSAELTLEPLAYSDLMDTADGAGDPPSEPAAAPASGTSTMPSVRGVEQQLDAYFDESQTGTTPAPPDDPIAAVMEEPPSSRESGITETVASAYTVFEAGTSGPSRRVITWGIVGAGLIGTLLVGAGFYYFQQAPSTRPLPSPSVAVDVEKSPPRELPVVPIKTERDVISQPVVRIGADTAALATATAVADGSAPAGVEAAPPDPLEQLAREPPRAATVPTAQREPVAPAIVPPAAGLRFGEVRIARSQLKTITEPLMNEAYASYVAGDYAAAERAYTTVLEQQPQHRDALLGMAALKLRDGDVAAAHAMYRDVLKRNPDNATAQAALFTLERGSAGEVTESRLKLLLDEGVDSGYIYFSLGNLYARNRRWADAQQAYFEALRHHPTNPDYNYNLAVALDRIGQRASAATYYETAIDLTDRERAGFDPARALARLQAIAGDGAQ